jgi:hypothetical protein
VSAAELGIGNHSAALVRGFSAVASNPAGLGMPNPSRVTAAVLPLHLGCAMGPAVTCGDVAEWNGKVIPKLVRELWIRGIEQAGRQDGSMEASVSAGALSVGRFGFQLSTLAVGRGSLNADASELVLFGDIGRTGAPRVFHLGGSALDGYAVTTAAVAAGVPVDVRIGDAPNQTLAVGATLKYTVGNALYTGRDLGSFFSGDPLEVWVRFPLVQSRETPAFRAGDGVGLDLGVQWQADAWKLGLDVKNVFNTFEWNLDELVFRPGTALFTQDDDDADFTPRPADEAPDALLEDVRAFRFPSRLSLAAAHELNERTTLASQLDLRIREGIDADPVAQAGLGVEYRKWERLPLRIHASLYTNGFKLGGGAGLRLGSVHITGALSFHSGDESGGPDAMVTVSFGGS